jgi:hypothetical protein
MTNEELEKRKCPIRTKEIHSICQEYSDEAKKNQKKI